MPVFIRQKLIVLVLVLLGFGGSLPAKSLPMNNQTSMVKTTLIDVNPFYFHYYSFLVSLDNGNGNYNIVGVPSVENVFPIKWKM